MNKYERRKIEIRKRLDEKVDDFKSAIYEQKSINVFNKNCNMILENLEHTSEGLLKCRDLLNEQISLLIDKRIKK